MKTLSRIINKFFSLAVALILTGMLVQAQESFKENWMSELKTELDKFEINAAGSETANFEAEMPVEDWMLKTEAWTTKESKTILAAEPMIEVESWMIEPFNPNFLLIAKDITDKPIKIEDWMINPDTWHN